MPSKRSGGRAIDWPPTAADLFSDRGSVRYRITAIATLVVALVLIFASVTLVSTQRVQLTNGVDAALQQRAADVLLIQSSELGASGEEGFAQLINENNEVIASSPNLTGQAPLPIPYRLGDEDRIQTVSNLAVDDDVFRVLSKTVTSGGGRAVLHVGATFDGVQESTRTLVGALLVTIPIVAAALAALVWWLVGRTLDPVEAIRAEVADIGATDLHRRVPIPKNEDEISRLAETMNGMLERLDEAVSRQQRFVGDASHELRSPLARMRTELEVELSMGPSPQLESLLEEVVELQTLIEDLLELAKTDAKSAVSVETAVDLDDVVFREVANLPNGVVDISKVSAAQVFGDRVQLGRAVRNLVENASRHAVKRVVISLQEIDGEAVLTVTDDGPGIPIEKHALVFERFGRIDAARNRADGGTGLGLAITKETIERHGGTIAIDATHTGGARLVVRLPAT